MKLTPRRGRALWHVVGVTREPFSPALGYIPLGQLDELSGQRGMASSLRLVLERQDPESISAVKAALDQNLEREGARGRRASATPIAASASMSTCG